MVGLRLTTVDNNVEIVSEYAGSYTVWYFERQSDGSYVIRNCSDLNKVLSVEASSTERGQMYTYLIIGMPIIRNGIFMAVGVANII